MKKHFSKILAFALLLILGLAFFWMVSTPYLARAAEINTITGGDRIVSTGGKTGGTTAYAEWIEKTQDRLNKMDVDHAQEITNLNGQIATLTVRIHELESTKSVSTSIQTNQSSDCSALTQRVSTLERVVSMMEVNIGSLYARMDQLLDPIKRMLKIK